MKPSVEYPRSVKQSWTYVSLAVIDGSRRIKPCEVSFDRICFWNPPHLTASEVEIIITNGNDVQRGMAEVLPHDPEETEIPIRLITRIT
jgi:hypothetical protein